MNRTQNENLHIANSNVQNLDDIYKLFCFTQILNEATRLTPTTHKNIATAKLIFSIPR